MITMKIDIIYSEANQKYDVFLDDELKGKCYNLEEVSKKVTRIFKETVSHEYMNASSYRDFQESMMRYLE